MERRHFLQLSSATAIVPFWGLPVLGQISNPKNGSKIVSNFEGDGLNLSSLEYVQLLAKLEEKENIKPDNYSIGGSVEELEIKFAKLLGKEAAVFMPTGTLANHLAIRSLAGNNKRVIVQQGRYDSPE